MSIAIALSGRTGVGKQSGGLRLDMVISGRVGAGSGGSGGGGDGGGDGVAVGVS